ncbi:hypothetical protein RJ641_030099 [Dillenia turbinata]|uniref:Uncharacterized protein n=1 Tax=Dillenia turbinata TaxID=194707 RepID=A0AAN8VT13_9MAGN
MAASLSPSSFIVHSSNLVITSSSFSTKCYTNRTLALDPSQFLPSNSILMLKKQSLSPKTPIPKLRSSRKSYSPTVVFAAQSNFLRVIQTVWKVGRDGVDAGTNLVPDSIPRPIARISVTMAVLAVALFVLKSFLSTAFFVLASGTVKNLKSIPSFAASSADHSNILVLSQATMGLIYFVFIALNKDEGPKGDGGNSSTEDTLEEARRIMEKYK